MMINGRKVGPGEPSYFIADLAANHDGDLSRAVELIHQAADAGADAAKFQHFRAAHIVSDKGFRQLGGQLSHQAGWSKSVFQVYEEASLPWAWTDTLVDAAHAAGIQFLTSPYDLDAIDYVDPFVPAFKIGSGDITWLEAISRMASKGKPLLLATGASNLSEVKKAVSEIRGFKVPFAIMQCNTNYTGEVGNLSHSNLRVLKTFSQEFPDAVLGLSDHTHGDITVLGAVAMGARVIEKHFTDDTTREGPDHHFSMTPRTWQTMVRRTRELESALGVETKEVAANERETVVIQRRGLRFARKMRAGDKISADDLVALRPATPGCLTPEMSGRLAGRRLRKNVEFHDLVTFDLLSE